MPRMPNAPGAYGAQMGMQPNPFEMLMGGGGIAPDQMMIPHLENIQQMDKSQLDGLLMSLLQIVGPEISKQVNP